MLTNVDAAFNAFMPCNITDWMHTQQQQQKTPGARARHHPASERKGAEMVRRNYDRS